MKVQNVELKVIQGDITALAVEALVNPAKSPMDMGQGLPKAFLERGGDEIARAARAKAPVLPGQAISTSAGKLSAKYVIHVVTTDQKGKTNEKLLRQACRSVFQQAAELKISSLAFPALGCCADQRLGSCSMGAFPWIGAAKILAQETIKFLKTASADSLKEIIFCLKDSEMQQAFEKNLIGYIRHIQEDLGQGPYVTVDAIIELPRGGIVVIERSNPPYGWALPGGFVDDGESLEDAVRREMKEETGLMLVHLRQFHVYSDPRRDPRFHTVTVVFLAKGKGKPKAGDDAQGLKVVSIKDLLKLKYAFDHKKVMADYLKTRDRA